MQVGNDKRHEYKRGCSCMQLSTCNVVVIW